MFVYKNYIIFFCFRIHPRDKQDVAYRLTLGARTVAYNEEAVHFLGPFPNQILSTSVYVTIIYDQPVSVTPSSETFEVGLNCKLQYVINMVGWSPVSDTVN